jgi:hypothetical protein
LPFGGVQVVPLSTNSLRAGHWRCLALITSTPQRIKRERDPDNVFHFEQDIPLCTTNAATDARHDELGEAVLFGAVMC